jgi:hypothetical protein
LTRPRYRGIYHKLSDICQQRCSRLSEVSLARFIRPADPCGETLSPVSSLRIQFAGAITLAQTYKAITPAFTINEQAGAI